MPQDKGDGKNPFPPSSRDRNAGSQASSTISIQIRTCPYEEANLRACTDTFREPSGRCSHLVDGIKTWGMAGTPYTRVLPAAYQDGKWRK